MTGMIFQARSGIGTNEQGSRKEEFVSLDYDRLQAIGQLRESGLAEEEFFGG